MIVMENILLERLPKMDVKIQVNCKHSEKHVFENKSHMGSMLSQLESTNSGL